MMKIFSTLVGMLLLTQMVSAATPIGTYYQINVTNQAAVVAALDAYANSPTGQKNPAELTLFRIMSNGSNPATHAISVYFASAEDMDRSRALNIASEDFAAMQASMAEAMTPVSESLFRGTGISAGSPAAITSDNPVARFILMDVQDPAAYVAAWTKMMASRDSDLPLSLNQIIAAGTADTSHVVSIFANNMAEMMAQADANQGNPAWAEFLASVDGIRTIEDDAMVMRVKSWAN